MPGQARIFLATCLPRFPTPFAKFILFALSGLCALAAPMGYSPFPLCNIMQTVAALNVLPGDSGLPYSLLDEWRPGKQTSADSDRVQKPF